MDELFHDKSLIKTIIESDYGQTLSLASNVA